MGRNQFVTPPSKLLVLDLDETLVYATTTPLVDRPAANFRAGLYYVYERPHVRPFLQACFGLFTVAVYTSASPVYAVEIVAQLFGENASRLLFVWASERCSRVYDAEAQDFYWRKNMGKVRKRFGWPLSSVIVVDDTPQKWAQSYGNLVHVAPWEGDPNDTELPRLLIYLTALRDKENVRAIEKRNWQRSQNERNEKEAL